MRKHLAMLAIAAFGLFAATALGGAMPNATFLHAFNEIVAWDPEMATMAPDQPVTSQHDFAVGSQKVTQPSGDFQHVRVSAHSDSTGGNPKGSVRVTYQSMFLPGGAADVKGDVVCLNVMANQAQVAALLREPFQGNTHVTLIIVDAGNPGGPNMGQSSDSAFIGFTSSPPAECADFGTTLIGDASGNLTVRDAL